MIPFLVQPGLGLVETQTNPINRPETSETFDTSSIDEETPVEFEEISGDAELAGSRPWQPTALGNKSFQVPKGMEIPYRFWLDVYTKYGSDQGVVHDADVIDCIYGILDFSEISKRTDLSHEQKIQLKKQMVRDKKIEVVKLLQKLDAIRDSKQLNAEEKNIWEHLRHQPGPHPFLEAQRKGRLRFQLGQRDRMRQGIFFSGRYLESFEKRFQKSGLPLELTRLPFVESSFSVLARSKVGASGLWQIMPGTGRPLLKISPLIDNRNDPEESARVAVKLFKANYQILKTWPLAVTAYNHGAAGVLRASRAVRSRALGDLYRDQNHRNSLGFASRNFFVSFLAALEAERNANRYFSDIKWSKTLAATPVVLHRPVEWHDVIAWFAGDDRVAQIFNPQVTAHGRESGVTLEAGTSLFVMTEKVDEVQAWLLDPTRQFGKPQPEKKSTLSVQETH